MTEVPIAPLAGVDLDQADHVDHVDHGDHAGTSTDRSDEHEALAARIAELRELAAGMGSLPAREVDHRLESACALIAQQILPHVRAEYERGAHLADRDHRPIPGREQEREIEVLGERVLEFSRREHGSPPGVRETLRGLLYDLHTLLHLHFAADR